MQLSKSRYLDGLWCPRLLWYKMNEPSKIPQPDENSLARMDEGTLVGELARTRYPGGALVEGEWGKAQRATRELLSSGKPLFEAVFSAGGGACKVDILLPAGDGYEIVEVKQSTKVKAEHLEDVAFQLHVLCAAGLDIRSCKVMHIDREYVRSGEVDVERLFVLEDVSGEVRKILPQVPSRIRELLRICGGMRPARETIHLCAHPYGCPVAQVDMGAAPEFPVTELASGGRLVQELVSSGVHDLREIPSAVELSRKQRIQVECARTGRPFIDSEALARFFEGLREPVHYLDFEALASAVPLLDGLSPYAPAPFQYSLHTREGHDGYLSSALDGRGEMVERLQALRSAESILAYNASYEKSCIVRLAKWSGAGWLQELLPKFVDLYVPFKEMWYYHPGQHGSRSIKALLPIFCGASYEGMEIADGMRASREFVRICTACEDADEIARVRAALERYCEMDTRAMVEVLEGLRRL